MKKPLMGISIQPFKQHIRDSPIRLSTDLVNNRAQEAAIGLLEGWLVWVRGVEIEGGILSLQQRQKTATDECLPIEGRTQMMRGVSRGRYIDNGKDLAKGVLLCCQSGAIDLPGKALTSSRDVATRKSLCLLSPAPVQK